MSRFLYFFLGFGVGTWWAANKNINVECQVHRTLAPPVSSGPTPEQNTTESQLVQELREELRNRAQLDRRAVWEQERERVKQFSQTAGDTVAELSEATLNTILQATEALKAKMAEHRAWREEERRLEEERRRNPPRLV
ncbi:hypothetical protein C8R43DRAFT_1027484 [Mycena crocata]|nr:hypothetical protein C8R43DRAFT_1027484 [Mycena crocata]